MTNRWDWDAQSRNKAKKAKPPYTMLQNFALLYKNLWQWEKSIVVACLLKIPVVVALPLLTIFMSREVVAAVTEGTAVNVFLLTVLILSLSIFAAMLIQNFSDSIISGRSFAIRAKYLNMLADKIMTTDYANIASAKGQNMIQRAFSNVDHYRSGTGRVVDTSVSLGASIVGLLMYSFIVTTLHPLIVIYLILMSVLSLKISKRVNDWEYKNRENWTPLDKKLRYIESQTGDFAKAKDIRLYNLKGWFLELFKDALRERVVWLIKENKNWAKFGIFTYLMTFVRDGIAYGYLIYMMLYGNMPVADFILYFGVIAGFAGLLRQLFDGASDMYQISLGFCDLREFLELKDTKNLDSYKKLPEDNTYDIEFKNVSFTYPGSDKKIIDNLSLRIEKGEKLALVGLNGAGKTTLVKLLCGLHESTEGTITVGGVDVREIDREEYFNAFSAVFQEVYMLPMTFAENVASAAESVVDLERAERVAQLAGIMSKVKDMPDGFKTKVVKSVFPDAIELSGGEQQKFALARALYKDAKIIVLDEPTAALDPIAENEMYLKYNEFAKERTSVFISHRLSSTSFCDRIVLIDGGKITEMGTHIELMEKGGTYRVMFDKQSHYYKNDISLSGKEGSAYA